MGQVMEQPTKRKLAAILMADPVGYSRLMQQDEEGTVASGLTPPAQPR